MLRDNNSYCAHPDIVEQIINGRMTSGHLSQLQPELEKIVDSSITFLPFFRNDLWVLYVLIRKQGSESLKSGSFQLLHFDLKIDGND